MAEVLPVTIHTIGGGVVPELFEREWAKLMENIDDPSTSPKKARKITLTFTVVPHESMTMAGVEIACTSSLVGVAPAGYAVHLVRQKNRLVASVVNPSQEELFSQPQVIQGGATE